MSFRISHLLGLMAVISSLAAAETPEIVWRGLDQATFEKARAEKKLVFLDLEAVWCHWCHVMDEKTYTDPSVREALAKGFIAAKVDQDSRPDLARRYEDYGWPALVVIDPVTLKDLAIGSGFHKPEDFLKLLAKAREPSQAKADKSVATPGETALSADQKRVLMAKLRDRFDAKQKGWGTGHKFVPWENIEFCIQLDRKGDSPAGTMAKETLSAALPLIDPQWGGLYQYSTDGDWQHPHFEKIIEFESEVMRVYSLAFLAWRRPEDLAAAKQIARHLHDFLRSPEGAYYTSQDADVIPGEHSADYFSLSDAERRKIGVPRVDQHRYARENGLAITALVALWQASGDDSYLEDATRAAQWIVDHRSLPEGGFSHDEMDSHGPFLADQVQMGRAFTALFTATADSKWLDRAIACAGFIDSRFRQKDGIGYLSSVAHPDSPPPVGDRNENIALVRWSNLLGRLTGDKAGSEMAKRGMRFLSSEAVQSDIYSFVGGVMLADQELVEEPVHIVVVGAKGDPDAEALFITAQRHPSPYRIIEREDPKDTSSKSEINYPDLGRAAAYFCADGRCSPPKFTAAELQKAFSGK